MDISFLPFQKLTVKNNVIYNIFFLIILHTILHNDKVNAGVWSGLLIYNKIIDNLHKHLYLSLGTWLNQLW